MVKRIFFWFLLAVAPGFSLAQNQSLSAFVDRTDISINDIITLTIRIDASLGNTRPSLASLTRDFEQVGGTATRSTYTNNNGNIQSWNEFSIMLRPLSTGVLNIPAFRVGSEVTNPIRINVGEASAISATGNEDIFMETTVSKEEIYVQEQLLFTIKIFYAISFDQGAQLTSPQVADAVVQQLGSDNNYQEVVDGIGYNVTERRFVIYPQSSGEMTIPPVYFAASVGRRSGINRFFNNRTNMREINLSSEAHQITVLPRTASFPGQTWLPAAQLTLEETWSGPLDNVEVGDAITRNIVLTAQGLSSSLLPGIDYAPQAGLKFYPDQPVREDAADRNGVVGKRSEGTAIVASQAGEFVLPEVRVPWWNTVDNQLETAVLPARTLHVVAPQGENAALETGVEFVPIAGQGTPNGPAMAPASQTSGLYLFWISSTVVFAAAWLFSTLMWLKYRRELQYAGMVQPQTRPVSAAARSPDKLPDPANCLKLLRSACDSGKLRDVRKAVILWAQGSFGDLSLQSLEHVARSCDDAGLTTRLRALDAALYGFRANDFEAAELYAVVAALHKRGVKKTASEQPYTLPPLYRI